MVKNWKSETCESCEFMVDGECRESPPSNRIEKCGARVFYSSVVIGFDETIYQNACSHYQYNI